MFTMTDVKTATVMELPDCDFCKMEGRKEPAEYDGKTKQGPWANMCQEHFDRHGVGLGTGKGQKLVLPTKQPDELIQKADKVCFLCGLDCLEGSWNKETGRYRILDDQEKIMAMISLGLYCEEV